jgi:hypothetical protein
VARLISSSKHTWLSAWESSATLVDHQVRKFRFKNQIINYILHRFLLVINYKLTRPLLIIINFGVFFKITTLIVTLAKLPPSFDLEPPAMPHLHQTASKYLDGLNSMTSAPDLPSLKLHRVGSIIHFVDVKI